MEAVPFDERKTGTVPRWAKLALGATGVIGAVLGGDQLVGHTWRRSLSRQPGFLLRTHERSDRTLVVYGGTQSDGAAVSEQVSSELAPLGNLLVVDYPKAGFDMEAITKGVFDTMREHGLARPSFVGGSMGGMAVAEALKFYQENGLAAEFGQVDVAILDSTASRLEDVDPYSRRLLRIAALARDSAALNTVKGYEMRRHHPLGADKSSLSSAAAQGGYMARFAMEPGALAGIAEEAVFIDGPDDPVVNTAAAYAGWNAVFGGELRHIRDPSRPAGSHAGCLKGYPDTLTEQLVRSLAQEAPAPPV